MLKIISSPALSSSREQLIAKCRDLLNTNKSFLYLLPTIQLKKSVETAIIKSTSEAGSGVRAFPDLHIHLFDGLVIELSKDQLIYEPPIRTYQQKLILKNITQKLAESGHLPVMQALVEYDGFSQSLLKCIKEIKATDQTPTQWLNLHPHSGKEQEIGLIYEKYEEFLTAANLTDNERNYERLIQHLNVANSSLNKVELVIIDGFFKLSQLQLRLIKALLMQGKEVWVHTNADDNRFPFTQEMTANLQAICEELGHSFLREKAQTASPRPEVLSHLCTNLFQLAPAPITGDEHLQIWHTPDQYREIEQIGRQIKSTLIKDTTIRLEEIAIILRNVTPYHFYIEDIFTELGIPYEITAGTELVSTPIFKLILKIYHIFGDSYSRDSVLEVVKSPYLTLSTSDQAGIYEELILEAGIIRGQAEWSQKLERLHYHLTKEVDRAKEEDEKARLQSKLVTLTELQEIQKKFFNTLHHLMKNQCPLNHSKTLLNFFSEYKLSTTVAQIKDPVILRRDLLSISNLERLLKELIDFDEKTGNARKNLTPAEFIHLLLEAAKEVRIPEVEVKHDAVQILTPSESRGLRYKLVFIGGLLEGEFPAYSHRDWLFKPEERRALKEQGVTLKQFSEHVEEERLFFFEAASTAETSLVLTSPILQGDEKARSSSFIQEVVNLYHEKSLKRENITQTRQNRNEALTLHDLDETLLKEMWSFVAAVAGEDLAFAEVAASIEAGAALPELDRLQNLFTRGEMVKWRGAPNFSKYDGLLTQRDIHQRLENTYHANRIYSVSQINDYAGCPFQFFCKRILHLEMVEEPILRLEPIELGNLYHQILFTFFKDFTGWTEESLENALIRLEQIAGSILTDHPVSFSLPGGLWRVYQAEILENLQRLLTFEYAEAEKQNYALKPVLLEASFGLQKDYQEEGTLNSPEPAIIRRTIEETGDEVTVKFSGKIDRIDMTADGRYLIIYDYKTGGRDGFGDMEAGIDLQLPVYIKAAQLLTGQDKEVIGAGYFSIHKCDRSSGVWQSAHEELMPVTKRSKNCLSAEDWQDLLTKADQFIIDYIKRIKSGDFRLNPVKCPDYCKFKKICRYDQSRIGQKLREVR